MKDKKFMDRRTFLKASGAAGAALSIGGVFPAILRAKPKEIPFAMIEPLTGLVAFAGIPAKNGAEMAVETINAQGGIRSLGGAMLKPLFLDTESKPEVGQTVAERAVRKDVVAMVGCAQSAVGMIIAKVCERNRIPIIVDLGSGDFITESGLKYVFRVMPSNTQQTESEMNFAANVGKKSGIEVKKVGIIYEDTASGRNGYEVYKTLASKFGLEVVSGLGFHPGTADVSPAVTKMKMVNPDFIFMYAWAKDSILLIRAMQEQYYAPPGIIGKAFNPQFIAQVGKLSEYLYGTAYFTPTTDPPGVHKGRNMKIRDEYERRYGKFDPLMALSYTAVMVLKDALERAGSTDPIKIKNALAATNMTGKDGYIQLVKRIQFDNKGQSIYAHSLVSQIRNEEHVVVWPEASAQMDPVYPMPKWTERG